MRGTYLTQKTTWTVINLVTGRGICKGTYSIITPDEYNNHFVAAVEDLTTQVPVNLYDTLQIQKTETWGSELTL